MVSFIKSYSDDAAEAATPEDGGSFGEWAMISPHSLRIFLEKSYVMTIDLLETMTQILHVIGLERYDLLHLSTLNKWLNKNEMHVWRVLLRHVLITAARERWAKTVSRRTDRILRRVAATRL
jgi:hypothetical protein